MSYKVVRNSEGDAVCFGPNDNNYVPTVPEGSTLNIEESVPTIAPTVPNEVSMAQARKALVLNGTTMASVAVAIAAISDPVERELAEIDWEYKTTVRRDSALVASLGTALEITEPERDALFVLAATL